MVISHAQPKQYIAILLCNGNCFLITYIPLKQIMYARVTRPLELHNLQGLAKAAMPD